MEFTFNFTTNSYNIMHSNKRRTSPDKENLSEDVLESHLTCFGETIRTFALIFNFIVNYFRKSA